MVQQSSLATAIRALMMLSCLIAVPAVAVSGKSLPEMFGRLVDRSWPAAVLGKEPIRGVAEDVTWRIAPESAYDRAAPEEFSGGWPAVEAPASAEESPVLPAVGLPAPDSRFLARQNELPERSGVSEAAKLVPVHRSAQASPAEPVAVSPAPHTDGFREVEERLRQLGATYYLLESWGQGKQLYRFYCRVAVTGSPNYTRYFEAIGPEGLSVMREVLAEVEAWRARR